MEEGMGIFCSHRAGVIRGGNYTWTTDIMKESGFSNYYTVKTMRKYYE